MRSKDDDVCDGGRKGGSLICHSDFQPWNDPLFKLHIGFKVVTEERV